MTLFISVQKYIIIDLNNINIWKKNVGPNVCFILFTYWILYHWLWDNFLQLRFIALLISYKCPAAWRKVEIPIEYRLWWDSNRNFRIRNLSLYSSTMVLILPRYLCYIIMHPLIHVWLIRSWKYSLTKIFWNGLNLQCNWYVDIFFRSTIQVIL